MGRRVGPPPPSDCKAGYLYFILRFRTIFDFPSDCKTFIFAFPDYIRVFRTPLRSDSTIDFSHRSAFHFPILYGLPTPQTIPTSVFRYLIPFAFQFPLRATFPTPPTYRKLHPDHPQHFRTLRYSPLLSPSQSPILSAHHPLNPLDFWTSWIPPAPDSLRDGCGPDG